MPVDDFPLELNSMGLEKMNTGQAESIELVLDIGQVPRDSRLLAANVYVIHTYRSGWRVQCVFFVIILLFSWKLHTGINRSSRSSLIPGAKMEMWTYKRRGR